jgi:ABC-type enterochelin transport system ATPase subunit
MIRTTFNVVALGAFLAAPVAAVALWLLLTDPVLANELADSNSIMPLVRTLVVSVGKAIAAVLAYL